MLINLRNALMAGKRLPYDAEVEYLESTRTQWIDTGILPVVGYTYEMTITPLSRMNGCIFGAARGSTFLQIAQGSTAHWVLYHSVPSSEIDLSFVAGQTCNIVFGPSAITINGNAASGLFGTGGISANTIVLFARKYEGSVSMAAVNYRMHSFKILNGDTVVADFIPVRKGTVGYLYDRVSGKLFGNAGTGDFVLGQDVVPVEYIESHGTEYINTGIYCNSDFYASNPSVEGRFMSTTTQSGDYYYGCATSWNNGFSFTSNFTYGNYQPSWGNTAPLIGNAHANDLITISHTPTSATVVSAGYGSITKSISGTTPTQYGYFWLFGVGKRNSTARAIRCYYMHISQNGTLIRNYKPIRVGTGSTWEGAMMDTLTRRIYRNAGTGAFTYGNDLKYPIPA